MASTSSSSSLDFSHENDRIDLESIRVLITIINQHIDDLLSDVKARKNLKSKCTSNLKIGKQEFFEFSEQSVISNLYWGIESVEAAINAKCPEEKFSGLKNSEKMLQVPALLNDHGVTAGIKNYYLVCCSYFYLSVVRRIQKDEWEVAIHFLQALLVSPGLVYREFAPELVRRVFFSFGACEKLVSVVDFEENEVSKSMRCVARKYKAWLMYYQVMSYGEAPNLQYGCRDIASHDDNSQCFMNMESSSTESSNPYKSGINLQDYYNFEKVHPVDPQENLTDSMADESLALTIIPDVRDQSKALKNMDKSSRRDSPKSSDIKFLQDILMESQSDTENSLYSLNSDFNEEGDSEDYADVSESSLSTIRMKEDDPQAEIFDKMQVHDYQYFDSIGSKSLHTYQFSEENSHIEQAGILEKVISKLYLSEEFDEDYTVEITTLYEMLTNREGLKYSLLKDVILDQLLMAISTSNEEGVIRASVSILSTIITSNKSVIKDIKQKGLQLCDLASALKRNVHEAAILIYLINPSPAEIKTLEILPILVEVICTSSSYKVGIELKTPVLVTPHVASLMIIEVLVTAFDYATNNQHLAAICSQKVICGLLSVLRNNNVDEVISLAAVLVKCMRFDGQCRTYISQCTHVAPFIFLLTSNQKHANFVALEFFHEILRIPRSSAISLLQKIQHIGGINNICALVLLVQKSQPEYKLLAASLLLQLDMLENSCGKIVYREEAVEALLESLTCEDNSAAQQLSAFILSNLGGTYAWTGEPCTIAWLVKKTGLTSLHHKNMIRNFDWSDQTLQDAGTDTWCSKISRRILKFRNPVFEALEKGLKSKTKRVSLDCLTAIAWLGCEIVKSPDDLKHSACEILLSTIEQYVHPGLELEERLLACLCIYNYTSGRGMQKLIHFSEGVRESLRRLSNITWMAEELLKVADYFQPNKWRISCVHTQVLEVGFNCSGAVSALIYYRGQLYSGFTDGSIKVWDIKGLTATLVWDIKEHRKAVTCFSLFEQGNCLLSGSFDKTIRIWQIVERKLHCIEVIATKEPIQSIDTYGELIFAITQSHKMKVFDASRKPKDFFKNKHVKCISVTQGKVYVGCTDSSIQEVAITNNRQQEMKAASRSWMKQNKSINAISLYKDWLYSASAVVEGSSIKEWRRHSKPQMSIVPEKRTNVVAMKVVEDFIYLLGSSSMNNIQIWLRGTQHKVGRLTAGNKITSLLTANDMILCGTEAGVIKGWIPL